MREPAEEDRRRCRALGAWIHTRELGRPIDLIDLSQPGLLPIHFYALMDDVVALSPALVLLEVNLRDFLVRGVRPGPERMPGIARAMSFGKSLRVRASLEGLGLSVLDPPIMRLKQQLGLLYVFEGARQMAIDWLAVAGGTVGNALGLRQRAYPPLGEVLRRLGASYMVDYASNPNADVLQAISTDLHDAGVPFIFYVSPIDVETLAKNGNIDREELTRRIEALRQRVGVSRAEWLDLHDTLPTTMFRDANNHLLLPGCAQVGRPLAEHAFRLLAKRSRTAASQAPAARAPGRNP